jgi:hypothetical protein
MENNLNSQPSSVIRITRASQYTNSKTFYHILIDNEKCQSLRDGESVLLSVPLGHHVLNIRAGLLKSRSFEVYVEQGKELSILVDCPGFTARNSTYLFFLCGILTALGRILAGLLGGAIGGGIAAWFVATRASRPRLYFTKKGSDQSK